MKDGAITVAPRFETKRARSLYGTARAQIANLVEGVTKGFEKKLEITGVGYRAALQGRTCSSRSATATTIYAIPEGIQITVPKPTEITIAGNDKQRVGQVAAEIRSYRPPEPYKGKGVKYADEFIFRKEGKKK
jgi:large subunit ribosomal protein L6